MRRLNLGVIGCGDIAGYMATISRLVPGIRLAACCDVHPERATAFANRFHISKVFSDIDSLVNDTGVNAVYIAVPHDLHAGLVLRAVDKGKAVLVEKPITRTFEEGQDLINSLRHSPVKVGVNYQYRYDPACYQLVKNIQSGTLGEVFSIRINLPWSRNESYFTQSSWHQSLDRAGGGTLLTQASHFLDITLWAIQDAAVSVFAQTRRVKFKDVEVEDLAVGQVHFRNGVVLQIHSTMAAAAEKPVSIEVYGLNGTAVYKNLPVSLTRFYGAASKRYALPQFGLHALQRSLSGFRDWVLDDKPYLIPAESALRVLTVTDGMYRSALSGKAELINDIY